MAAFRLSGRCLGKVAGHVATGRQPDDPTAGGAQIIDSLKQSGVIPQNALQNDGGVFQTASVRLVKIPFVPQQDFDKLLHLADCAVIRGEDSFVRTQLAGKPFLAHLPARRECPSRQTPRLLG